MKKLLVVVVLALSACASYTPPADTPKQNYAGCLHHGGACITASLPAITDEGLGAAGTAE